MGRVASERIACGLGVGSKWSDAKYNRAIGISKMLLDIVNVDYVSDYCLIITFENGEKRLVDLKDRLKGPIFEPLKDLTYFKKVRIDRESGTIVWPNGADKAPDTLYNIGRPV